MKGYKGFDKDLKCYGGYQYEIGRTETTDEAVLCKTGFHFCERPLDVFRYFAPTGNRFCEIEAEDVSPETEERDTKRVAKKLTVKGEIGVAGLVKAAVNIGIEEAKSKTTGHRAHAATTGNYAHAATTGNRAHAATTGFKAHAATTGFKAHAATTGNYAHAATTGNYAHAATTGDMAHAATTGDMAHRSVRQGIHCLRAWHRGKSKGSTRMLDCLRRVGKQKRRSAHQVCQGGRCGWRENQG